MRRPPARVFLKKHHERTLGSWVRARLGLASPASPGRIEAENVTLLAAAGIPAMEVMAFGEQLHKNGLLESFVLTPELSGYTPLDRCLRTHFALANESPAFAAGVRRDAEFDRLLTAVAAVAGRLHQQGFNHRDLYCCHFLRAGSLGRQLRRAVDRFAAGKSRHAMAATLDRQGPGAAGLFGVRGYASRGRRMAFFKAYLGVAKLRPQDKRLARSVLLKQRSMESKLGPHP